MFFTNAPDIVVKCFKAGAHVNLNRNLNWGEDRSPRPFFHKCAFKKPQIRGILKMKTTSVIASSFLVLAITVTPAAAQFVLDVTSPATLQFQMPNFGAPTPMGFGSFLAPPLPMLRFQPAPLFVPNLRGQLRAPSGFQLVQFSPQPSNNGFLLGPRITVTENFQPWTPNNSQGVVILRGNQNDGVTILGDNDYVQTQPRTYFPPQQSRMGFVGAQPQQSNNEVYLQEQQQTPQGGNSLRPRLTYSAGCQTLSGALSSLSAFLEGAKAGASCDASIRIGN
jgi:hypothetical protein